MLGQRQGLNKCDANELGLLYPDCACNAEAMIVQRYASQRDFASARFRPLNREWQETGKSSSQIDGHDDLDG
jgi:hypothetical protein